MDTKQSKPSIFIVFLLYLPLIWIATGVTWMPQGDKGLVPFILVSAITSLSYFKLDTIRLNSQHSLWGKGLIVCVVFSIVSYFTHGFGSQELRGLIIGLVFFYTFPRSVINVRALQWLLLIAAINSLALSSYFGLFLSLERAAGITNAVIFATYQGLIVTLAACILAIDFKGKKSFLLYLAIVSTMAAMVLTQSRGAILSTTIILVMLLVFRVFFRRVTLRSSAIAVVVAVAVLFLSWPILNLRLQATTEEWHSIEAGNMDTSIGLRLQMYREGWQLILAKPILGHGRIYKEQFIPSDELSETAISYMVNHFHNNFIDKLVISGVVGLALLLFLLCYPAYYGYRYERYKALLFMLPPIYFSLASVTDSPFRNGDTISTYLLVMSVIFLLGQQDKVK